MLAIIIQPPLNSAYVVVAQNNIIVNIELDQNN
jgi:hypothetical protein